VVFGMVAVVVVSDFPATLKHQFVVKQNEVVVVIVVE